MPTTTTTTTDSSRTTRLQPRRISPSSLYQRKPSLWMPLAIAQTLFYLFIFPTLCRQYVWDRVLGRLVRNYGQNVAEWIFYCSIGPIFFFSYTLAMIPIYAGNYSFFEQYKIQKKSWPWFDPNPKVRQDFWKISLKSLRLTVVNIFILIPILVGIKIHYENNILLKERAFFFQTTDEHWPSTWKNIRDMVVLSTMQEFGFFVTHRMMHAYPFLYQFHKVHHEYKMNTTLAAQHNHPVDYIISLGGPAVLPIVLFPYSHSISTFQYIVWSLWANLDDHSGYAFPWSPVRWFPGSALTDEHDFHHSQNKGCFGSKLSCFGLLFGDYKNYDKYYANEKDV